MEDNQELCQSLLPETKIKILNGKETDGGTLKAEHFSPFMFIGYPNQHLKLCTGSRADMIIIDWGLIF